MCIVTDNDIFFWLQQLEAKLGYTRGTLRGKSRLEEYVLLRAAIYYLLLDKHFFNKTKIGNLFDRDHSTIVNAINVFEDSAGRVKTRLDELYEFVDTDFGQFLAQKEVYNERIPS